MKSQFSKHIQTHSAMQTKSKFLPKCNRLQMVLVATLERKWRILASWHRSQRTSPRIFWWRRREEKEEERQKESWREQKFERLQKVNFEKSFMALFCYYRFVGLNTNFFWASQERQTFNDRMLLFVTNDVDTQNKTLNNFFPTDALTSLQIKRHNHETRSIINHRYTTNSNISSRELSTEAIASTELEILGWLNGTLFIVKSRQQFTQAALRRYHNRHFWTCHLQVNSESPRLIQPSLDFHRKCFISPAHLHHPRLPLRMIWSLLVSINLR